MTQDLAARTFLVLEDDYLLATDLRKLVTKANGSVCGPFANSEDALEALKDAHIDGALLDIHLGEGPCFEVAEALMQANVPFAFVTGYQKLPERWRGVPHIVKPFEDRAVIDVLARLPN